MRLFKNVHKTCFSCILLLLQLSSDISTDTAYSHTASLKTKKTSDDAKRQIRIEPMHIKCTHTVPHIIEFFECHLSRRNNRVYTSGSLRLRQPIARLEANAVLDIYSSHGQLKNIFNLSVDCCAIVANGRHNSRTFDNILQSIFTKINVLPKCPLKANLNYTITDFDVNESILPVYIPKTYFNTSLYFRYEGRPAGQAIVVGRVLN
ncbi:uncharacterized protein LOC114803979 [Zeugodacus cucurbitae]|uniref:uncharacterized protein LOC114803979 n=1 Tax=Zeugodacus cucurbitae TaxID=28588 RepID=UPI0023D964E0|nr:uncharacterized protein LOC114803979 [Zeugodacus cucurbitae]